MRSHLISSHVSDIERIAFSTSVNYGQVCTGALSFSWIYWRALAPIFKLLLLLLLLLLLVVVLMLLFQHFVYTMECNEIINGKIPWAMFYYNAMFENVCFGYAMVVYIIHFSARNRISSLACNRSNIYTYMYQIHLYT